MAHRILVSALVCAAACTPSVDNALDTTTEQAVVTSPIHAPGISNGYLPPSALEGVTDQGLDGSAVYSFFRARHLGSRQYNVWWSGLEDSGIRSSLQPILCPSGYVLMPSASGDAPGDGFHRYRCINSAVLGSFDHFFEQDAASGLQTAVVLWSAPAIYRYAGCTGSPWDGSTLYDGCVPRDDAMDDWEDYVNLLASRYNGGAHGKISSFIIWNENASATWFNYSPIVPSYGTLTAAQKASWILKYSQMMMRAHAALQRHTKAVMLYASTDEQWAEPPAGPSDPAHIGTKNLVSGLWTNLGTSINWSLAVHPYGDPVVAVPAGQYGLHDLQAVVDFQTSQLSNVSAPADYAQDYIIASEQLPFDPGTRDETYRATKLCQEHAYALAVPHLLSVSNNHFYGSDEYSILSSSDVAPDLSNATSVPTGKAYAAFDPAVWNGQVNYCSGIPVSARSNNELWPATNAIAGLSGDSSCYSSNAFATAANDNGTYIAVWLAGNNQPYEVSGLDLTARVVAGKLEGFPKSYQIYATDAANNTWVLVGTFSTQPQSNGIAHVTFPAEVRTWGVMVIPQDIGVDDSGTHYFQLCGLHPDVAAIASN
jgi:hypothetical protein